MEGLCGAMSAAVPLNTKAIDPVVQNQSSFARTTFLGNCKLLSVSSVSKKSISFGQRQSRLGVSASLAIAPSPDAVKYDLPTWARFEIGSSPVFWETANGCPPSSGELLTIWLNPAATKLTPNPEFGVGFNGGFNSPIMCGGEPRMMTKKERGPNCTPFFTIKINVPIHATHIEFSFTDGKEWEGPYFVGLEIPSKWKNQSASFFNEGLKKELEGDGACEVAIYPDAPFVQDRCVMPGGISQSDALSCELDIVPGCTDPASAFFDPFANVDDGSCPIDEPEKKQ